MVLKRKGPDVILTDWALAQYLLYRGLSFSSIVRIKPTEHIFTIHDPEHEADAFAMQYIGSESSGFQEAGRLMHRLVKLFCSASPEAQAAIDAAMAEGVTALKRFHRPVNRQNADRQKAQKAR